jgi:hypothetical protein
MNAQNDDADMADLSNGMRSLFVGWTFKAKDRRFGLKNDTHAPPVPPPANHNLAGAYCTVLWMRGPYLICVGLYCGAKMAKKIEKDRNFAPVPAQNIQSSV